MKKELDEALVKKYPKIFRDRNASMHTTAMCWGFACGDGWYDIIDIMCRTIQNHIDSKRDQRARQLIFNRALKRAKNGDKTSLIKYFSLSGEVSDYSLKIVDETIEKDKFFVVTQAIPQVVAVQVKEKYGTLRFYYDGGDDIIDGIVTFAENLSIRTCETCGSRGKHFMNGWWYVACEAHTRPEDLQQDGEQNEMDS